MPSIDVRLKLSALWLFILLNIVFRDLHQTLSPGYIDWVIEGEMFGMIITDELLLFGGVAVEVMLIMVIAPHFLPRRLLRITNLVVVIFSAMLLLFTPPIDPDDVFFLIVCLSTLAAAAWHGWRWLEPENS